MGHVLDQLLRATMMSRVAVIFLQLFVRSGTVCRAQGEERHSRERVTKPRETQLPVRDPFSLLDTSEDAVTASRRGFLLCGSAARDEA